MVKKKTIYTYYCDLCGEEITGRVYSPIWGEMDPDGDRNYDRGGCIINVDICENCRENAERMIEGLFEEKKREDTEPELAQELAQTEDPDGEIEFTVGKEPDGDGEKKLEEAMRQRRGGRAIKIDIGKMMALHNAGWSNGKIADELRVSTATIQRRISEVLRGEK